MSLGYWSLLGNKRLDEVNHEEWMLPTSNRSPAWITAKAKVLRWRKNPNAKPMRAMRREQRLMGGGLCSASWWDFTPLSHHLPAFYICQTCAECCSAAAHPSYKIGSANGFLSSPFFFIFLSSLKAEALRGLVPINTSQISFSVVVREDWPELWIARVNPTYIYHTDSSIFQASLMHIFLEADSVD